MERWYGELKIIKRLHHANVVRALDVPPGLHYEPMGNVPFICMEYCDKGDLRQVGVVMGVYDQGDRWVWSMNDQGDRWVWSMNDQGDRWVWSMNDQARETGGCGQ